LWHPQNSTPAQSIQGDKIKKRHGVTKSKNDNIICLAMNKSMVSELTKQVEAEMRKKKQQEEKIRNESESEDEDDQIQEKTKTSN
jgi:hypothetical protein